MLGAALVPVEFEMGPSRSDGSAGRERLRWTQELHDRFVEAVTKLGGPDSKSLLLSLNLKLVQFNYMLCACILGHRALCLYNLFA